MCVEEKASLRSLQGSNHLRWPRKASKCLQSKVWEGRSKRKGHMHTVGSGLGVQRPRTSAQYQIAYDRE